MKKRYLTLAAISVLCLASLAACNKEKENKETDPTPTVAVSDDTTNDTQDEDLSIEDTDTTMETIAFGGNFSREDANLSFYIAEGGWNVTGYHFANGPENAPVILSGTTTLATEGPVFLYSDAENELSFTFASDSLTVAVTKGTAYKGFEGTYPREVQMPQQPVIITPERGSSLELLGRISLTHYMLLADGLPECMINLAENTFDQAYAIKFLPAYADLFLSSEATLVPEVSEQYLVYTMSKDALNDLFLTASAGTFDVSKFDGSAANIVVKEDMYYIPCLGSFAGGLTASSTEQELVSEAINLGGVVAKSDGTRYDLSMSVSTSENSAAGKLGIQVDKVIYTKLQ